MAKFLKKGMRLNPNGRPKGSKNKFTNLRDAFINAFKELGGERALLDWMDGENVLIKNKKTGKIIRVRIADRKKEFFKMVASMLPKDIQVSGPEGVPLIPPVIIFQEVKAEEQKPNV